MSDLFFPSLRCDLPSLPAPDFDFVSSCDISPPPGPIMDCPAIDIEIDPPVVTFPCPPLNFTGGIGYGGGFSFVIGAVSNSVDCGVSVSFSITIPDPPEPPEPPCPDITIDGTIGYGDGFGFNIGVLSGGSGSCEFDFSLDITIPEPPIPPCPTFNVNTNLVVGVAPGFGMTIENTGNSNSCDFNVNVELSLPDVLCPEINLTTNITGCGTFTGTVTTDPETCTFDIDLDLDLTDCQPGGDVFNFYFYSFFYSFWYTFWYDWWYGWWSSWSDSEGSDSSCACIKCGASIDATNVYGIDVCGVTWYFNDCGQFIGVLVPDPCPPYPPTPSSSSSSSAGGECLYCCIVTDGVYTCQPVANQAECLALGGSCVPYCDPPPGQPNYCVAPV